MDLELILEVLEESLRNATDVEWPGYQQWRERAEEAVRQIRKQLADEWHDHIA